MWAAQTSLKLVDLACSIEASRIIAEEAQLFKITVSFGSVSSLISLPCYMSHASIPADVRAARGLPDDLVRISVGIEDPEDLLEGELGATERAKAVLKGFYIVQHYCQGIWHEHHVNSIIPDSAGMMLQTGIHRSSSCDSQCSCYTASKENLKDTHACMTCQGGTGQLFQGSEVVDLGEHICYSVTFMRRLTVLCCVDLQQACHKAMSRTGMEAEAPAIDAEILGQTDREQELLDRIAQLEAQLQVQARHGCVITH